LKVKIVVRTVLLTLQLKYEQEPFVRKFLDRFGGRIADSRYSDAIELEILLPESRQKGFMDELKEATHSTVKILAS
jgi:putative IMPACT (imprinted ancient) family translation regulator